MKIEVKRSASGQYREAKATDGGTTIDLGLLNHQECGDLAESLLSTVWDLAPFGMDAGKWFRERMQAAGIDLE